MFSFRRTFAAFTFTISCVRPTIQISLSSAASQKLRDELAAFEVFGKMFND